MSIRNDLREMIEAYLACALWTDCEEAHPGYDYELPPETKRAALRACMTFYRQARPHLALYHEQAPTFDVLGNDLWLTRNHHGAGFWDRGLGDLGDILTEIADNMGGQHASVGSSWRVWLE